MNLKIIYVVGLPTLITYCFMSLDRKRIILLGMCPIGITIIYDLDWCKMQVIKSKTLCEDCGCNSFEYYSDTLLACVECSQIIEIAQVPEIEDAKVLNPVIDLQKFKDDKNRGILIAKLRRDGYIGAEG